MKASCAMMKRAHEEALTLTMGRLLAETVRFSAPVKPDLVVPVPMHWTMENHAWNQSSGGFVGNRGW